MYFPLWVFWDWLAGLGLVFWWEEVSPKENSLPLAALPTLPGLHCLLWLPVALYPVCLSSLGLSFAFSNCEHLDALQEWSLGSVCPGCLRLQITETPGASGPA